MKNILFFVLALMLLSAGCNPFATPPPAGVVKTVNGGSDWQFSNTVKGTTATLAAVNVSSLAFDPKNHETVFAGTYTNGLFKSTDSGATWSKILSKIAVYDFAVSPIDSKTIYAAGIFSGHGKVLQTTDGGATWIEKYNDAGDNTTVRSLSLNPGNPNQLVIGTSSGVVVASSDSGLTWRLLKNFNDKINKVIWLNGNIYVLLSGNGLYESTDNGGSFISLSGSLTNNPSFAQQINASASGLVFNQLYVDPLFSGLIYMTTSLGLYKSVDEGKTWTAAALPVKKDQSTTRAIAVFSGNSNLVYTSVGATVLKSVDAGNTWQTQGINTSGFINYLLIDPTLPQIAYGGIYVSQ